MSVKKTEGSVFAQAHTAAANFAAEKPAKKRRKLSDHIEYDVMRSNELGYGPHYGKYKADHPDTRAEFESLTGGEPQKIDSFKTVKQCPAYGEKFIINKTNANKIYCCDDCRRNAEYDRQRKQGRARVCEWCGKEIPLGVHRTTYCSNDCYHNAQREKSRLRAERRAKHGTD